MVRGNCSCLSARRSYHLCLYCRLSFFFLSNVINWCPFVWTILNHVRIVQKMQVLRAQKCCWRSMCGTVSSRPLHVCIVGSGPAGFYTADKVYLLSFFLSLFYHILCINMISVCFTIFILKRYFNSLAKFRYVFLNSWLPIVGCSFSLAAIITL